jgi:uncharacterized membrane protein
MTVAETAEINNDLYVAIFMQIATKVKRSNNSQIPYTKAIDFALESDVSLTVHCVVGPIAGPS